MLAAESGMRWNGMRTPMGGESLLIFRNSTLSLTWPGTTRVIAESCDEGWLTIEAHASSVDSRIEMPR